MLEHGGKLRAAALRYDIPESDWLDLSTGINPNGWPVPLLAADLWQRLPQDDDGLDAAATEYYGTDSLLAVSGSQAAIQVLPMLRTRSRVALVTPSYAEHAYAWREHKIVEVCASEILQTDADVVVIVNPNNPTGKLFSREELLALHTKLAARGGWLVVDEAYMDVTPEHSLASACPLRGLIVLRSLGKFFGLAGVRVGFVLAEESLCDAMRELLGPWTIAAPSRHVAMQALQDAVWQHATRAALPLASQRLQELLRAHGLVATGASSLFQWVCCADAQRVHEQLAQRGILTRVFAQPVSVRFGLPCDEVEWTRLDAALAELRR